MRRGWLRWKNCWRKLAGRAEDRVADGIAEFFGEFGDTAVPFADGHGIDAIAGEREFCDGATGEARGRFRNAQRGTARFLCIVRASRKPDKTTACTQRTN